MSNFGAAGLAFAGVGVNTVRIVHDKRDPFPALLAGTMFVAVCVVLEAFRPRLGVTVAAVFLLGSVMTNGAQTITVATQAVAGAPQKIKPKSSTTL